MQNQIHKLYNSGTFIIWPLHYYNFRGSHKKCNNCAFHGKHGCTCVFPLCMHSLSFSLNKLSFEAYQTEIGQPKSHLSTAN